MLKKCALLLLICVMLFAAAQAETAITAQVMGRQAVDRGGDTAEATVMRLDFADGGIPSLYVLTFCPQMYVEGAGWVVEDVNFDGYDDLAIITEAGAANTCFTFYLWNAEVGAYEWYGGDDLWNYQLYPAQGIVRCFAANGWAGLLHENRIYGWDADRLSLTLLRSSEWNTLVEGTSETRGEYMVYTERYDDSVLVETYINHMTGDTTVVSNPTRSYDDPAFMAQRFLAEDDFLGLETEPEGLDDGSNG